MFGNRAKPLLANLANVWQSCEATGGNVYAKLGHCMVKVLGDFCHCVHAFFATVGILTKLLGQSWLLDKRPYMAICQTILARTGYLPDMAILYIIYFYIFLYISICCSWSLLERLCGSWNGGLFVM